MGELINLYKDDELVINPAYQRYFRWDESQKTRFIESLLLGIPTPPKFAADIRYRRIASLTVLMRLLLSLDYVLEHSDLPWLPTEPEKVAAFEALGIERRLLPSRLYRSFGIAVAERGGPSRSSAPTRNLTGPKQSSTGGPNPPAPPNPKPESVKKSPASSARSVKARLRSSKSRRSPSRHEA